MDDRIYRSTAEAQLLSCSSDSNPSILMDQNISSFSVAYCS
jgi:hypothetical protein